MKPAVVAIGIGLVFAVGIGVGISLGSKPPAPAPADARGPEVASQAKTKRSQADFPPPPTGAPGAATKSGASAPDPTRGTSSGPRTDEPFRGPDAPPPPPPPPPSADALAEAERIKRYREKHGDRGGGKVTTLVYPKDKEQAEKLEAARQARWERRLAYANDVRINGLRGSVGLTDAQEKALRKILDKELEVRMAIVDQHRKKEISDVTFDEKVQENRDSAKEQVQTLLSEQQFAKYVKLKPREQVLRDDVK